MGFLSKITRAVTLWTDASFRRAEVLSEAIFYGIGMAMIGVVFTILAATGTFPSSVEVMKAHNTLGMTLAKYVLYALSGVCAYLAATSARDSLRKDRPTTGAKMLLVLAAAAAGASAVMTVVAMIISSNGQHPTPVWVYIIQALVVILRLLFLSVLVMAIYTLFEADRSPEIAEIVAGLAPTQLPTSKAPYSDPAARSGAAAYQAPQVVQQPMDAAAAPPMLHTLPAGAAPHTAYYPPQPMPPQHGYYYPPQPMQVQGPVAAADDAFAAGPGPAGGWPQPGGPQPHMAAAGWAQPQPGGHFVPAQPPPAAMGVAAAAPAAQRGRQGPSLLATYAAFRMGQRAGRRQQHRMGRRC